MNIAAACSRLGGQEHLLVHKPVLWTEIAQVIKSVDARAWQVASQSHSDRSGDERPDAALLARAFQAGFRSAGWQPETAAFYTASDSELTKAIIRQPLERQRRLIVTAGHTPILVTIKAECVKERVSICFQFGGRSEIAYDLFVQHSVFFADNVIDVGVEIVPMYAMISALGTSTGFYEEYAPIVLKRGPHSLNTPIVLVGVTPE